MRRGLPGVCIACRAPVVWVKGRWLEALVTRGPGKVHRSVKPAPLRKLVAAGLLEVTGDSYKVRGLDAERQRRVDHAKYAIDTRWSTPSTTGSTDPSTTASNTQSIPSTSTRTRRDKTSTTPPPSRKGNRKAGTNPRALGTNPRANGTSIRQERERQKTGPTSLHDILRRAAAAGDDA